MTGTVLPVVFFYGQAGVEAVRIVITEPRQEILTPQATGWNGVDF